MVSDRTRRGESGFFLDLPDRRRDSLRSSIPGDDLEDLLPGRVLSHR